MTTKFMITAANNGKMEVISANLSLTVGRSEENDIQLLDPKVSRFHCKIENTDRGIMLFDLLSKNGSFVNGVKCETTQLNKGDILKIGDNILTFTPLPTPTGENYEKTMVIDALPAAGSHEMRTRQFEVKKRGSVLSRQTSMSSTVGKFSVSSLFSKRSKLSNFFEQNKIYLTAAGIFCLALVFFSGNHIIDTFRQPDPQKEASARSTSQSSTSPDIKTEEKRTSTQENIEKSIRVAREASTILATGDFAKAILLFNEALSYDAENILAKEGIAETHAHVDRLANICFEKGQQGLKAFRYQEALKEFETVTLLLKDRNDDKLFLEANKLINQARQKITD